MRKIQIVAAAAAFVTLTLAGCSGEQIAGVPDRSLEAGAIVTSASVDRPWKGTCDVVANFTGPTTLLITGTCRITHLGKSDVVATQTIGPPDPVTGIIPFTNTAVYTAANGDNLSTSTVGFATPSATGLTLSGVETANGGTGRFADATGSAELTGAVVFTGPASTIGSFSVDGRLNY